MGKPKKKKTFITQWIQWISEFNSSTPMLLICKSIFINNKLALHIQRNNLLIYPLFLNIALFKHRNTPPYLWSVCYAFFGKKNMNLNLIHSLLSCTAFSVALEQTEANYKHKNSRRMTHQSLIFLRFYPQMPGPHCWVSARLSLACR